MSGNQHKYTVNTSEEWLNGCIITIKLESGKPQDIEDSLVDPKGIRSRCKRTINRN